VSPSSVAGSDIVVSEFGAPRGEAEMDAGQFSRARSGRFIGSVTLPSVVSDSNGFWIVEFIQRPFPLTRGGFDALGRFLLYQLTSFVGCVPLLLL
jgi:hypothetical protein